MRLLKITVFLVFLLQVFTLLQIGGVAIVLRCRNQKDLQAAQVYINNINSQQCPILKEFVIIKLEQVATSSQTVVSSTGLPLYFSIAKPPLFNFTIPAQVKSQLIYFSNRNNSQQNCQQITNYITTGQKWAVGWLMMVGQAGKQSYIQGSKSNNGNAFSLQAAFNYGYSPPLKHYSIIQNIRLIPRHFIEVAHSSIPELVTMRQRTAPQCQQILLNFMAMHLYPDFKVSIQNFGMTIGNFDRNEQIKTKCIQGFVDALSYCPLYYIRKGFNKTIWQNPNLAKVIEMKRLVLDAVIQGDKRMLVQGMPPENEQILLNEPTAAQETVSIDQTQMLNVQNQLQSLTYALSIVACALGVICLIFWLMIRKMQASLASKTALQAKSSASKTALQAKSSSK